MSRWITVLQATSCTKRSRQWVHNRIDDGTFTASRKGRRVDIDAASVQEWMVAEMDRMEQLWSFYYHHLPMGYEHGKKPQK